MTDSPSGSGGPGAAPLQQPILVRGRIVYAQVLYQSARGDYTIYRYGERFYRVDTP